MNFDRIVFGRRALALVTLSALLSGCMTSSPIWDAHFGEAVRAITQAQIIDPHAGEHPSSRPNLDGTAAVSAMDTYNKSFDAPKPTVNQFVIGIGGGAGSSGGQ